MTNPTSVLRAAEFAGGILDGGTRFIPDAVAAAVTTARNGERTYYALDDDTGTFVFTGFNDQGAVMAGIVKRFTEAARSEREAAEDALRPVGCGRCGNVYGSHGAYLTHFEGPVGSACLEGDARGQLVQLPEGVWVLPWSDAAKR